ncbi:hypothetical protein F4824DRAFT_515743 [Ustulina deusta]|nr:hypothetical protein F4824DRAFT_515743 [Ustulina deusta]
MPIQETLGFESDDFRRVVAKASTEWLRQQEVIATRKGILSSFGVGVGVTGAVATGGVSVLFAAYKTRSAYVAYRKLEIIEEELRKRNVELHKFSKSKDLLGPIAVGAVGAVVGTEVAGLIDGMTNIEQMGAGIPNGASPSTGLLDNPGEAARGFGGAVEQIMDSITGVTSTTAAIATTDAVAYHAGMIQAQTVVQELGQTAAEELLFSPGEPSPECKRSVGVSRLSCDKCEAKITQGPYWHCCSCHGDNYDICQKCYDNNVRCKHTMKKLQTPTGPDFIDNISATPGYGIWKPKAGASISRSELMQRFLFQCNFCKAEVRQGKIVFNAARSIFATNAISWANVVRAGIPWSLQFVQLTLPSVQDTSVIVKGGKTQFLVSVPAVKARRIKGFFITVALAKTRLGLITTTFATPATAADLAAKTQGSIFCFLTLCPAATMEQNTLAPVSGNGHRRTASKKEALVLGVELTSGKVLSSIVANAPGVAQMILTSVCAVIEVGDIATTPIIY